MEGATGIDAASAGGASEVPAFGSTIVNRPARHAGSTLKVVVFNAHSGARFEGILACLRRPPLAGADVIILCEADWHLMRSDDREFACELAGELEMSFAYGPEFTVRRPPGLPPAFLGNAILSTVPLADARMVTLPTIRMSRRNARLIGQPRALIVTAGFAGRRLTLTAAHLHSRWSPQGRARQMAALLDHLEPERDGPVILGGDLNTTSTTLDSRYAIARVPLQLALRPRRFRHPERHEPLFGDLERAGFELRGANVPGKPTFTFHRAIPPLLRPKLDWIALRGLQPVAGSARVVPARASFLHQRVSDHDFVMCEVRL